MYRVAGSTDSGIGVVVADRLKTGTHGLDDRGIAAKFGDSLHEKRKQHLCVAITVGAAYHDWSELCARYRLGRRKDGDWRRVCHSRNLPSRGASA